MGQALILLVVLFFFVTTGSHAQTAANFKDLVFAGYQGWFATSCDAGFPRWRHWAAGSAPSPGNVTFELYPDVRDYAATDLCQTNLANLSNGSPSRLFASGRDGVLDVHFSWMQQYGIDGVALQRFLVETTQNGQAANDRSWRDTVLQKVKNKAELYGRHFYIMYDITSANSSTLVSDIQADFIHIEELSGNPLGSPQYAKQAGKPVIAIWGCGFEDRPCTTTQARSIINWFRGKGYYVLGGIPHWWRTLSSWESTFFQYDMIKPWPVGAYKTDAEIDLFFTFAENDRQYAASNGVDYQNVMWPGGAWSNFNPGPRNETPRRSGNFLWRQAYRMKAIGGTGGYIAMFDEYDEGTAIAKAAENASMIPTEQYFLTLDADGSDISSDFYLRLAGEATKMIKGILPITSEVPIPYRLNVSAPTWPDKPIDLVAQCSADGTQATLSWRSVNAATAYAIRINYQPNDSPGCVIDSWYCGDPPDKIVDSYAGTSYVSKVMPDQPYGFWVHGLQAGNYGDAGTATFVCRSLAISPPNAPTGLVLK